MLVNEIGGREDEHLAHHVWVLLVAELTPASSDGASMTTVELLDALTRSLQHP